MSQNSDIAAPILIAILGAGSAIRFGADKLSQACAGKPLGKWALDTARSTGLPVVWVAAEREPDFVDCDVVPNPRAGEGMGTSVACAATAARERAASALLVVLADMPLVTQDLLQRVLAAKAPAACSYGERPGVPALFPATLFPALEALQGDTGAAAVLRGRSDVTLIEAMGTELLDVDTPEALAEGERLLLQASV